MQRNTGNTETITVEYGFLDSTKDDVKQLKNDWQKYADAVVRAVLEYTGISTIPTENVYTVQRGDSLWSIAKKLNVSVDELKRANNLSTNLLSIGQTLKIPTTETEGNVYTVQRGDSLYKIAQKYNTTVNDIIKLNNLTTQNLTVGQKLLIPSTEEVEDIYIVKSGDTLYKIAQKYNTSTEDLMKLNNLTSNILTIGQIIKLPTNEDTEVYIVKSGDTLYNIAQKYNTTVNSIKQKNNLTSDILSIGQELTI